LTAVQQRVQRTRQFFTPVLTALGIGTVAGIIAYCGGPYIAAFAGWVAGVSTTVALQIGLWLRRTFAPGEVSGTSSPTAW
jgi:hypothetical protein